MTKRFYTGHYTPDQPEVFLQLRLIEGVPALHLDDGRLIGGVRHISVDAGLEELVSVTVELLVVLEAGEAPVQPEPELGF